MMMTIFHGKDEHPDDLHGTAVTRVMHGRATHVIGYLHLGVLTQQKLDDVLVPVLARPVQGRAQLAIADVDHRALPDQVGYDAVMTHHGGYVHRREFDRYLRIHHVNCRE